MSGSEAYMLSVMQGRRGLVPTLLRVLLALLFDSVPVMAGSTNQTALPESSTNHFRATPLVSV